MAPPKIVKDLKPAEPLAALEERVAELESLVAELQARQNSNFKTIVWMRFQVVDLLKRAGIYSARDEK